MNNTLRLLAALGAATLLCTLAACSSTDDRWKAPDQPSNVLRTQPDPTTANSGVTAGTVANPDQN